MANPRYYNPPERTSRRDSKLSSALSLAGLGLEQSQIADRQQQARVMQAIQLLGLQQQQEADRQRAQQAAGVLGEAKLNREGDEKHRKVQEQQGADAIAMQFVAHLLGDQRIPVDSALGFAPASQQPNVEKMRQTGIQSRVGQAMQTVGPLYASNPHDPAKIAEALKLIEPGFAAQLEVWNALPWDQLNQGLSPNSPSLAGPTELPREQIPADLQGEYDKQALLKQAALAEEQKKKLREEEMIRRARALQQLYPQNYSSPQANFSTTF